MVTRFLLSLFEARLWSCEGMEVSLAERISPCGLKHGKRRFLSQRVTGNALGEELLIYRISPGLHASEQIAGVG